MNSIIMELQRDALDKNICVPDLLRKSLIVAHNLKLEEFMEWIKNELDGYKGDVPQYRILKGDVRGYNPNNGWIPLNFQDSKSGEIYSKQGSQQSIAEIEHLVNNGNVENTLRMSFSQDIQRYLSKVVG